MIYFWLGAPWWGLIPLLLVPDLSMVGYLHSPRTGAFTYNLVHNWGIGLIVLAAGFWLASDAVAAVGAVLVAHVGMDRAMGYGLKLRSAFHDTHLGRIGKDPGRAESPPAS